MYNTHGVWQCGGTLESEEWSSFLPMLRRSGCSFFGGRPAIATGGTQHRLSFWVSPICTDKQMDHALADLVQSRYKVRPKFHAFHCQIILNASAGAKYNVRYGSCFNEEDMIGKLCRVTKGALHASSTSKRLLQRWLLQMNAHLCA